MKYFEKSKKFMNSLQKAHDKFYSKGLTSFDDAYKIIKSYKTFNNLEGYVIDYIIDYILETEGNENKTYISDNNKIVKIDDSTLVRAKELKEKDIILNEEYKIIVSEYTSSNDYIGNTHNHTFKTKLKVIRVKELNGKISVTMENNAHVINRKYEPMDIIEINNLGK